MNGRNVNIVKKIISALSAASLAASAVPLGASAEAENLVFWQCTTDSERWADKGALTAAESVGDASLYISVDDSLRYQTLTDTPFGGCFNDRGYMALSHLSDSERSAVIAALFSDGGLRLTSARMPLGNSDYSANRSQSYDELPDGVTEDYALDYFSVDTDRDYLIPFIEEAEKYRPGLKLWASPWSPPSWMKNNSAIYGGGDNTIIWTNEILNAYARYFAKFIKAYRAEGHNIYMVMPQNEPTMDTAYSSCIWTGEQLNEFIRDYLSPILKEEGLGDVEIYLGTFTDSQANRCDPTLNDPVTSQIISGIGFQWWSPPLCKRVYRQNTSLTLMQSETRCGDGANSWQYAEDQFDLMKEFFESGVNSYMLWNMVLDEKGENTSPSPWHQNAPVIVNSVTNAVSYTPQYYEFKHFSHYIDGGARRISASGSYGDKIAFQNPDGENILLVKNSSSSDLSVVIDFNGKKIKPTLPAHSINTFRTMGDKSGFADSPDLAVTNTDGGEAEEVNIKLRSLNGGKALSVNGASFDNGADIISWTDQGTADQMWTLEPSSDGCYKLINYNSLKLLGVYGGSKDSGARCVQWDGDGSLNQQWRFEPIEKNGKTVYKIVNRSSGLCLAFKDESSDSGVLCIQTTYTGSDSQLWDMVAVTGEPFSDRFSLFISNTERDGNSISCAVTCTDGGSYTLYCAFYDSGHSLVAVESSDISFASASEAHFSAKSPVDFAEASVYGWRSGTLIPSSKKYLIK